MKKPLIIGITGGIGGGKSTLSKLLRDRGYFVYDTDLEAKRLQNENTVVRQKLIELFGDEIYSKNELNRKKLANLVFKDSNLLSKLNNIVHPIVRLDFKHWIELHKQERYLFVESAIMFESGFYELVDKIIVVTAPEEIRINRVVKRDHVTPEQVKARIANQIPEEEKIKRADIVLNSDGKDVLNTSLDKIFLNLRQSETDKLDNIK